MCCLICDDWLFVLILCCGCLPGWVVIAVVWIVLALWCRFPGFGLPYGLASLLSGGFVC